MNLVLTRKERMRNYIHWLHWFKRRYNLLMKGTESEEINVGYILTCGDCGTTDNVRESGFCVSCEADFDEILESMNDVEEDDEEP